MAGRLTKKPTPRRDAADAVRLKAAGDPAHINAREAQLLERLMPEAAGPVITRGLLAEAGRGRDDRVTRLIPAERALLKAHGGSGAINPRTGLLEYDDSDDDGNSGNTSNAGENTGGMSGAPGSGVAGPEGPGTGRGDGPGAYGDYSSGSRSYGYDAYGLDARGMPRIESILNTPSGFRAKGYENMSINPPGYAAAGTGYRLVQELLTPSVKAPGRFSPPTAKDPGFMGSFLNQITPSLMGMPAFGVALGVGKAMDRASTPEERAASAAEMAERGAQNSTGQDRDTVTGLSVAELARATPGTRSGSETASRPAIPPGWTLNPAGQLIPLPNQGKNRPAWRDPLQNEILDYILRGGAGRRFKW